MIAKNVAPYSDQFLVYNLDYREFVSSLTDIKGRRFTFFDPPYPNAKKSKLYGDRGDLHTGFSPDEFELYLKSYNSDFLLTYCYEEDYELRFKEMGYETLPWSTIYSMTTDKSRGKKKMGNEMFVYNWRKSDA